MRYELFSNDVNLCGTLDGIPTFSHVGKNKNYYVFPIRIARLSDAEDVLNVICEESLLDKLEPDTFSMIKIKGELRSYNNKSGVGNKLIIFVYATEINLCDDYFENSISLRGAICKKPNLRTTPLGRDICDLLIAVNRPYGHSDYLPCICWGQQAKIAAKWSVGEMVKIDGRIQSRDYIKVKDGVKIPKTAYEISAFSIDLVDKFNPDAQSEI